MPLPLQLKLRKINTLLLLLLRLLHLLMHLLLLLHRTTLPTDHRDKVSLPLLLLEAELQETLSDLLLPLAHLDLPLLFLPVHQTSLDLLRLAQIEQFPHHSRTALSLPSLTLLPSSNRCHPLLLLLQLLNKVTSKLLLNLVSPLLLDLLKVKVAQSRLNLELWQHLPLLLLLLQLR